MLNRERFHFAATYGPPAAYRMARARPTVAPEDGSPLGTIVAGEAIVRIVDGLSEHETALRSENASGASRSSSTLSHRSQITYLAVIINYPPNTFP